MHQIPSTLHRRTWSNVERGTRCDHARVNARHSTSLRGHRCPVSIVIIIVVIGLIDLPGLYRFYCLSRLCRFHSLHRRYRSLIYSQRLAVCRSYSLWSGLRIWSFRGHNWSYWHSDRQDRGRSCSVLSGSRR